MRFQVSCDKLPSMPLTIQTSPFHVQIAARWPSLKKSNPPKRIQVCHGFGASGGGVISSTAKGPSSDPILPRVAMGGFQRGGPPFVRGRKSRSSQDLLAIESKLVGVGAGF